MDHALDRCPECEYKLSGKSVDRIRETIELPEPRPIMVDPENWLCRGFRDRRRARAGATANYSLDDGRRLRISRDYKLTSNLLDELLAKGNHGSYDRARKLPSEERKSRGRAEMKKRYTAAFQAEIVQEVPRGDKLIKPIASTHGIHPNLIGEWQATALKGLPNLVEREHSEQTKELAARDKQPTDLNADIGRLTTQVAWLKRSWHPRRAGSSESR